MRTIEVLAKRHDEWMKMARSFKVSEDDAKELVQEMYLRLDKYVKDVDKIMYNETEVNTFYVYTAISNLITTGFHKTGLNWRHKKTKISYFEELFEHKDHSEEIKETISLLDRLDVENADDMESFSSLVDSQCMFESLFGNIKKDIDDVVATWYWYDAKLFRLHFPMVFGDLDEYGQPKKPMSMRKIVKETGISLKSVFNSLKAAKMRLRKQFQEDYNKYKKSLEV